MSRCFDTPCPRCGASDGWGEFPSGEIVLKDTGYYKVEITTCCPGRTYLKDESPARVRTAALARGWTDTVINECLNGDEGVDDEECPCGIDRRDCTYHKRI